jgi:lipopolysaccharide export system protein LptA
MMIHRQIFCGLAIILSLVGLSGDLFGAVSQKAPVKPVKKEQPIQIVSDRLEVFNDKRMVVFSGNAVATQGERTIRSERLILYYKEKTDGPSKPGAEGMKDLERVEAKGGVTITEGERIVTGEEAIFEQATQIITVTGNPVLREGENVIRGNRVIVFLEENRGVVESAKNKRVTATVYPSEKDDKKR